MKYSCLFRLILLNLFLSISLLGNDRENRPIPDLTKGEKLTRKNEGEIGPLGFSFEVWRPRPGTPEFHRVRQFLIKGTDKGGPTDGVLRVGDVLMGANGSGEAKVMKFSQAPQIGIADAINDAEARSPATINLLVWRPDNKNKPKEGGKAMILTTKLETLGAFSESAPYDCPKSRAILEKGLRALLKEESPGAGGYNLLCLLAGNDPQNSEHQVYRDKAREWAHSFKVSSYQEVKGKAWHVGSILIALAEYFGQTRDEEIFPTLESYAIRYANGQSWFGTTGHGFSYKRPDGSYNGLMPGYGALNSSGLHGFLGLTLARKVGVKAPEVEAGINRARIYFGAWAHRNGIGYGEHEYGVEGKASSYDYNGHNGVAALVLSRLEGEEDKARWFSKMSAATTITDRMWAHAGPFFAQVYNPLGAAVGGEKAANHQFREIKWHLTNFRNWDGTFKYEGYNGWSRASTQLLFYALPLRRIHLTGKGQSGELNFNQEELKALESTHDYDPRSLTLEEVVKGLSSDYPADRTRASRDLAARATDPEKKNVILGKLHSLISQGKSEVMMRHGVAQALSNIKDPSSVVFLVRLLSDEDYYVRYVAAKSLMSFSSVHVMPQIDKILEVAARNGQPTFPLLEGDPLQFSHGALADLLFDGSRGLLRSGFDGVDRKKLWPAVRSLAKTPAGAKRSQLKNFYKHLSKDELLELGETVIETVRVQAPGDAMFAAGAQVAGLDLLLRNSMAAAFPLVKEVKGGAKHYSKFDASVLELDTVKPVMEEIAKLQAFMGMDISKIEKALKTPSKGEGFQFMKKIHGVKAEPSSVALPRRETKLMVDATNYARKDKKETSYRWRKVYGPGRVSFSSNDSWESKVAKVDFLDERPGVYRFEVTMSDSLGYSTVSEFVDVTLGSESGEGAVNQPPLTSDLRAHGISGEPCEILLKGYDPDGDQLGYVVTKMPVSGSLKGFGERWVYTPRLDFSGSDVFEFEVIDGKGGRVKGVATIQVKNDGVGVAVYEGFDYPAGKSIQGIDGGGAFGFKGPWKLHKETNAVYLMEKGSYSLEGFPATGGKIGKGNRWWFCSRYLDQETLLKHRLFEDGEELWFSLVHGQVDQAGLHLEFGFREEGVEGGADVGLIGKAGLLKVTQGYEEAGESKAGWGMKKQREKYPAGNPYLIIGRCIWGGTDENLDRIELYRVFRAPGLGPMVMDEPIATLEKDIDQKKLNSIYMKGFDRGYLDEIRVGKTLKSVLLGTVPLDKESPLEGIHYSIELPKQASASGGTLEELDEIGPSPTEESIGSTGKVLVWGAIGLLALVVVGVMVLRKGTVPKKKRKGKSSVSHKREAKKSKGKEALAKKRPEVADKPRRTSLRTKSVDVKRSHGVVGESLSSRGPSSRTNSKKTRVRSSAKKKVLKSIS